MSTKKIIKTTAAPEPIGPYSQAVFINNMLFLSGQVAKKQSTGEVIKSSIQAETIQVMENLLAVLKEAGLNFSHVVKTTIFLKDLNQFAAVNETYGSYFSGNFPARETVEVARLPLDVNVEISMIAVKD